jgi:hypothetical protein
MTQQLPAHPDMRFRVRGPPAKSPCLMQRTHEHPFREGRSVSGRRFFGARQLSWGNVQNKPANNR